MRPGNVGRLLTGKRAARAYDEVIIVELRNRKLTKEEFAQYLNFSIETYVNSEDKAIRAIAQQACSDSPQDVAFKRRLSVTAVPEDEPKRGRFEVSLRAVSVVWPREMTEKRTVIPTMADTKLFVKQLAQKPRLGEGIFKCVWVHCIWTACLSIEL